MPPCLENICRAFCECSVDYGHGKNVRTVCIISEPFVHQGFFNGAVRSCKVRLHQVLRAFKTTHPTAHPRVYFWYLN
jgi:hypothetical protein